MAIFEIGSGIYPCDRKDSAEPIYYHSSAIFADPAGQPFSYSVYIPAYLDLLIRNEASRGFKMGWPQSAIANGLCMEIVGKDMVGFGLVSRVLQVDGVAELLK